MTCDTRWARAFISIVTGLPITTIQRIYGRSDKGMTVRNLRGRIRIVILCEWSSELIASTVYYRQRREPPPRYPFLYSTDKKNRPPWLSTFDASLSFDMDFRRATELLPQNILIRDLFINCRTLSGGWVYLLLTCN